jgi:hypothetical protein
MKQQLHFDRASASSYQKVLVDGHYVDVVEHYLPQLWPQLLQLANPTFL